MEDKPEVFKAKLWEQAERYKDMRDEMKKVAMNNAELTVEERNLFSVAYKNVVGAHRASWRILSTIETKETDKPAEQRRENKVKMIKECKESVEKELQDICQDVLNVLDKLIPEQSEDDAKVFFKKMQGDYQRYRAEFTNENERKDASEAALTAYQEAQTIAVKLPSTNAIRLGLALNFSVFYYEIRNNPDEACKLAKKAFDDAISDLDTLQEDSYKDSTLIMQLLRDNLTLWTSDMEGDSVEVQDIEGQDAS